MSNLERQLRAHRFGEIYRVQLLDYTDKIIRDLTEFSGGSIEYNLNRPIRGGGTLEVATQAPELDIATGRDRVKITYEVRDTDIAWDLGVFLLNMPEVEFDDDTGMKLASIGLKDKLTILDEHQITDPYSLAPGENITDYIKAIFDSLDEPHVMIEDSDMTTETGFHWEVGTPLLRVINDLLEFINYFSLYTNGSGYFVAEKYRHPEQRQFAWHFERGFEGIHLPRWTRSRDWHGVPNSVTIKTAGTEEQESIYATVLNTDPNDEFSYQARGNRWISLTEEVQEAKNIQELQAVAERRMIEVSSKVTNIEFMHAPLNIWPNDRVGLNTRDYVGNGTVSKWSLNLSPGSLMSTSIREVERFV